MAPSELRRQTISQLRKTFLAMMSPRWDRALEGKSDARLTEAARTLLAVQRARLRLGNAKLAGIRDDLKANEADLASGITINAAIEQHAAPLEELEIAFSKLGIERPSLLM